MKAIVFLMLMSFSMLAADEVDTAEQQYKDAVQKAQAVLAEKLIRLSNGYGAFGRTTPTIAEKAKSKLASRGIEPLVEIPVVPNVWVDLDKLTTEEWDGLPGIEMTIKATGATKVASLQPDQKFVIIPNPSDTWNINNDFPMVNFRGGGHPDNKLAGMIAYKFGGFVPVNDTKKKSTEKRNFDGLIKDNGLVVGHGNLYVYMYDPWGVYEDNNGQVRIKVCRKQ